MVMIKVMFIRQTPYHMFVNERQSGVSTINV